MSPTRVTTTDTCGRCGEKATRDGAEGNSPSIDWASIEAVRREKGTGWERHTYLMDDIICPACQRSLLEWWEK